MVYAERVCTQCMDYCTVTVGLTVDFACYGIVAFIQCLT